jgi:hypothetical protein
MIGTTARLSSTQSRAGSASKFIVGMTVPFVGTGVKMQERGQAIHAVRASGISVRQILYQIDLALPPAHRVVAGAHQLNMRMRRSGFQSLDKIVFLTIG